MTRKKNNTSELLEGIQANLKDLAKKTKEVGNNPEMLNYLKFVSKFYNYSPLNCMSILTARPEATLVKGYKSWQDMGRQVKKGSKGIPIIAPAAYKAEKENGEEEKRIFFRTVYVFDVSDTEGKDLPTIDFLPAGEDSGMYEVLKEVAISKNIDLEEKELMNDIKGLSHGGKIELESRLDQAGKFSVLVHELAHEMLHKGEDRKDTTKKQRETEAESVAYVVCSHFGLDSRSENYLFTYDVGEEEILNSFSRIQKVAKELIEEISKSSKAA